MNGVGTPRRAAVAQSVVVVVGFVGVGLAFAAATTGPWRLLDIRWAVALLGLGLMAALALVDFKFPVALFVAYSILVGWLRRELPGGSSGLDPLLLILPICTVVLGAVAVRRGATRDRTRMTNLVLALVVLSAFGAFNPLQGSLVVGLVGVAFFGVPMLWFFVGRQLLSDEDLLFVMKAAAWVALVPGIYGIAQSRGWLTAADARFFAEEALPSAFFAGQPRPIGTMASTGEFSRFAMVAAMLWLVAALFARRVGGATRLAALGVFGLMVWAALLTGVRVSLLTALVAAGLMVLAVLDLTGLQRLVVAGLLLVGLFGALQVVGRFETDNELLGRQLNLSDPLDPQSATVSKRIDLAIRAAEDLPTYPLGRGTGITTPAASRFGGRAVSTETDVGDVATSWGVPGLVAYSWFYLVAIGAAFSAARRDRTRLSMAVLVVIGVGMSQWINGGLYSVVPLVWLSLGWLDARRGSPDESPEARLGMVESSAPASQPVIARAHP